VLAFAGIKKHPRDDALLAALMALAAQLALFLPRADAEARLRQSEERFRRTFELAAVGVAHIALDRRFQRVCGADDQAVDCFLWGSRSWIAGASNFLPAEHVALYRTCVLAKDFVKGQKLMHAMLPMFYLLEQGGKYIQYVKYGCELAGIPVGHPREPLQPLSDAEKADFRRLYDDLKAAGIASLAA